MAHIFISYSHKDGTYAHQLSRHLEEVGWQVWIDDRIDYSASWTHVIQDNLDNCAVFIVIMSPRSYQSTWVQNELSRAQRLEKPIFPLLLEGDGPWLSVEATQYTDVRNGSLPPDRFYVNLEQVLERSEALPKPKPKADVQPKSAPAVRADSPGIRTILLVGLLVCLIGMFVWNTALLVSRNPSTAMLSGGDLTFVGIGVVGILITGSGISRVTKKPAGPGQASWSPPKVAVQPFRLTPSFESGIYGGLIGGAIAGLIIGILYRVENPEAEWTIIPQVFLFGCVAGSCLGAASQLTILWFRYLVAERKWPALVFNEVTGGLLGSALIGIPVGALGGWQLFPHGTAIVDPALLIGGALVGSIFAILGALVYNYQGRFRYVLRAFLTSFAMVAFVSMLATPAFESIVQSMLQADFLRPCITVDGNLLATGFCYPGLGALIGLAAAIILGLQIGLTLLCYRLWESLKFE